MQKVRRTCPLPLRSHRSLQREQQSTVTSPKGATAAARITTLAPAFGQAMPSLDGVRDAYSHEFRAELLYDLCAALVRDGLGSPATWRKSSESAVVFAQHSIMSAIGEQRWNLLRRNVEYHLQVSDVAHRNGDDAPLENGQLFVTVECGGSGYLKIGPAVQALEEEAAGLGAAFYWILTFSLYRVMRIYNHSDAMEYEERLREMADNEDETSKGQYEFPEVERALPDCIRETPTGDRGWTLEARRLLGKHRSGKYRSWIERLRRIQQLSRLRLKQSCCRFEEDGYDSPPLPSLLVAFKDHDAITACFDEEGRYMLEGSCEPAVGIMFCPRKTEERRRALLVLERFFVLNQELYQLAEELQNWEEQHAGTRLDRGEPSLPTA
jgi:hypothetical protein